MQLYTTALLSILRPTRTTSTMPLSDSSPPPSLSVNPVHLGLNATTVMEPLFTGMPDWYQAYSERYDAKDGKEGRLVSMHTFSSSWDVWEMHPHGTELVLVTSGTMTLIQEINKDEKTENKETVLTAGQYAINEPGVWHTADMEEGMTATAVFITAGMGTQHRNRAADGDQNKKEQNKNPSGGDDL